VSAACPICGKPSVQTYRPFCSKRCADVDLNRWLGGGYAIPAVEPPDFDEEQGPAPSRNGKD
jgi:endogenous inhibitor of DNA gyrase (YacG/DUF329 family)